MKQITIKLMAGNDLDEDELVDCIEDKFSSAVVNQVFIKPVGYQPPERDQTEEIK